MKSLDQTKSLIALLKVVLAEAGTICDTSTTLDLKEVERRVECQGLSFLTIALPSFCSSFERSLDQGLASPEFFPGFAFGRGRRRRGLPVFLQGFLGQVFDSSTGTLLESPSVDAIRSIRQVTLLCGKIEMACTPERDNQALLSFLECELDVHQNDARQSPAELADFLRMSSMLWADFFCAIEKSIFTEGLIPKHGPGATADGLRGNAKYDQLEWTQRLEKVLPHWENLIPSESFLDRLDSVTIHEPGAERPVKVTLVPKTMKTPRVIAVEPTCMQYMQQGILALIKDTMPRIYNTRNYVCSDSQEPNQRLAQIGSSNGSLATLDLSEASDRVSLKHVELLLQRHGLLREVVMASRSLTAYLPGFGVIPLSKFASMGSALCFPFEALVFATVVFLGIEDELSLPLSSESVRSFAEKVRVYGDDIIVPVEFVDSVIRRLESFGLKVNSRKSFWTGKFRESCGKDYYDGSDVSVARVRNFFPNDRTDVEELASIVSLRNQMFHLDLGGTVDYLDNIIRKIIPFPYVEETSVLLGRHFHVQPLQVVRYDESLQLPLVRGVVISTIPPVSILDDYGALMKFFLKRGHEPFAEKEHLQRAGRPSSGRIKTRWACPF